MNVRVLSALFLLVSVEIGFSSYSPQCNDKCDVDPCRKKYCFANGGAKCVSRCCQAYFYDKYGNDITSKCDCPAGVKPHYCKFNLCDTAKCNKSGECRTDRCGGCNPVFYDSNAKAIPGCPIIEYDSRCPAVRNEESDTCFQACLSNRDCRDKLFCCPNGCGTECRAPPQDDRCPPPDPSRLTMRILCGANCIDNDDCKGKDICCFDGCGRKCISTPFLDPRCKPHTELNSRDQKCTSNKDCGPKRMCCGVGDETGCFDAPFVPDYDDRCPAPYMPASKGWGGVSLYLGMSCSNNSNCRSDYICCPQYTGATHCVPKPEVCDLWEFEFECPNLCKNRSCSKHAGSRCRVHACNGCKVEFYDRSSHLLNDCFEETD